jgi:hypothetical protein
MIPPVSNDTEPVPVADGLTAPFTSQASPACPAVVFVPAIRALSLAKPPLLQGGCLSILMCRHAGQVDAAFQNGKLLRKRRLKTVSFDNTG